MSPFANKVLDMAGAIILAPFAFLVMLLIEIVGHIVEALLTVLVAPFALLLIGVMHAGYKQEERILKYGTEEQKQQVRAARIIAEREADRPYGKSGSAY